MAYNKLSTANLPSPAVNPARGVSPRDYFQTFTYSGNGADLQVGDVVRKPTDTITIASSLNFDLNEGSYLTWTPSTPTNQYKWTWSGWVKFTGSSADSMLFSQYDGSDTNNRAFLGFDNGANLTYTQTVGGTRTRLVADTSAFPVDGYSQWKHIVVSFDSAQGTASNRTKIYIDGVQMTKFSPEEYVGQNTSEINKSGAIHQIGAAGSTALFSGALTDVYFVDGLALGPDSFGGDDANGIWVPKTYSGAVGNNGFHLKFETDSAVEAFNTVTYQGISFSAKKVKGFGFNPDFIWLKKRDGTPREHLLFDKVRGDNAWLKSDTTDVEATRLVSFIDDGFSVDDGADHTNSDGFHYVAWGWSADNSDRVSPSTTGLSTVTYTGNGSEQSISGFGYSPDLVWIKDRSVARGSVLFDTVRGAEKYLRTNTTDAEAISGTETLTSFDTDGFTTQNNAALNNTNEEYVAWTWDAGENNTPTSHSSITYTGTGTTKSVSELGFSPDLVWIKSRNHAHNGEIFDTYRGPLAMMQPSQISPQYSPRGVSSFDSDGFSLDGSQYTNSNNMLFVAWAWDAGDGDYVQNGEGSITSFVKSNPTQGFSIVAYTGTGSLGSVGHGLNQAPDYMVTKRYDSDSHWWVHGKAVGASDNNYVLWNTTGGLDSAGDVMSSIDNDTFSVISNSYINAEGGQYVSYCWHTVAGYSKFGTYNGSSGNVTVTGVGFRPGFLLVKNLDSATSKWGIVDGSRSPLGDTEATLYTAANSEYNGNLHHIEFTDDGFIVKNTDDIWNTNGDTFLYAAWKGSYSDYITDFNTDGSVDSRVKTSTEKGFSIVRFDTGASGVKSFGHGLGATPGMCIFKNLDGGSNQHWNVWHSGFSNLAQNYMYLNLTNAVSTDSQQWGNIAPTSTEFTFQSGYGFPANVRMIGYCWTAKAGYSDFGTYQGNSGTEVTVTTGFRPGWLMIKNRDLASEWHVLDTDRSLSSPYGHALRPNSANAEFDPSDIGATIEFTDTGFKVSGNVDHFNYSNNTYIYAAFASTNLEPLEYNFDGDIQSTLKANQDYGFSIVAYKGNSDASKTIGHGLSSTPSMIIVKGRNVAQDWIVYHEGNTGSPETQRLYLNNSNATDTVAWWNNTAPTSDVFSVSNFNGTGNSYDYIAYCWAAKAGYSDFGSYTGTGSNLTIDFGFKPAFFLTKSTSAGDPWVILDATRETVNDRNFVLQPNSSASEDTDNDDIVEFTDTGVVIKSTSGWSNRSGIDYIYAAFADTRDTDFFKDSSTKGNDWQPVNLEYEDVLPDTPSNSYPVINPGQSASINISKGGLNFTNTSGVIHRSALTSQILPKSGKWYWEVTLNSSSTNGTNAIGISDVSYDNGTALGGAGNYFYNEGLALYGNNGQLFGSATYGTQVAVSNVTFTANDVMGVAYDADNKTMRFYKNGVLLSNYYANIKDQDYDFVPAASAYGNPSGAGNNFNFGQLPFVHSVPSGFTTLSEDNIPVDDTNMESPDLVWIKSRTAAYNHCWIDSVRGVGKFVNSNNTYAENDNAGASSVVDFNKNGFTLGPDPSTNSEGENYVAWTWKAGGTAVTNNVGTISSQVSANQNAGFSIVKYTGTSANATVGHGLNQELDMLIVKNRDRSANWHVWHNALTGAQFLELSSTAAAGTDAPSWNSTVPTSTVFSVGTSNSTNASGEDLIAYCWHSVAGYSKFGSYTGNGSSDGVYVFTGFKPAFLMVKKTDGAGVDGWTIVDNKRDTFNVMDQRLQAQNNNVEGGDVDLVDFLSNGFKIRYNGQMNNQNGTTYIYMAFAENPEKFSNAR